MTSEFIDFFPGDLKFTAFDPGSESTYNLSHFEIGQHHVENFNPVKLDMSWSPVLGCNRISGDHASHEGATFVSRPGVFLGFEDTNNNLDWELRSQTNPDPSPETQALTFSSQALPQPPLISSPSTLNNQQPSLFPKPLPVSPSIYANPPHLQRRKLNTLAARKHRQKRIDQLQALEAKLKEVRAERDALKVKAARLEGEVEILRGWYSGDLSRLGLGRV